MSEHGNQHPCHADAHRGLTEVLRIGPGYPRYRGGYDRSGAPPREEISLAFVTALQTLPPRQRAALILRDELGFSAAETADMLSATVDSVNSALKRARAAAADRAGPAGLPEPPPAANSPAEQALAARLTTAYQSGDVGLVPTRANGQLAFAAYVHDPGGGMRHAMGLLVFTVAGEHVTEITRFEDSVLASFGLPLALPGKP